MARLEGDIAFTTLLQHMPNLQLAVPYFRRRLVLQPYSRKPFYGMLTGNRSTYEKPYVGYQRGQHKLILERPFSLTRRWTYLNRSLRRLLLLHDGQTHEVDVHEVRLVTRMSIPRCAKCFHIELAGLPLRSVLVI